jgi:hypothetical protein
MLLCFADQFIRPCQTENAGTGLRSSGCPFIKIFTGKGSDYLNQMPDLPAAGTVPAARLLNFFCNCRHELMPPGTYRFFLPDPRMP